MVNNLQRDFKGVWIPKEIWLDKNLSWTEKLILVEIDSLSELNQCFASNEHFSEFIGVSKDRVTKIVASLKSKGYVETYLIYKQGTKEVEKRIITTVGYRRKQLEGIGVNDGTPPVPNDGDNNTISFNNTITNTKDMGKSTSRFVPPTFIEVKTYCDERMNGVDPQRFIDFYEAKGWYLGKNKIKNWKACVRTWENNNAKSNQRKVVADF